MFTESVELMPDELPLEPERGIAFEPGWINPEPALTISDPECDKLDEDWWSISDAERDNLDDCVWGSPNFLLSLDNELEESTNVPGSVEEGKSFSDLKECTYADWLVWFLNSFPSEDPLAAAASLALNPSE